MWYYKYNPTKIPPSKAVWWNCRGLLDGYLSAAHCFAGKAANPASLVGYDAVAIGMNGVVAASGSTFTGTLGLADLAHDNLAVANLLAAKQLNAKALTDAVAGIFAGTACFYV